MGQQIAVLVHGAARWTGTSDHNAASAFSRPGAPSTITSSGVFNPRLTRSSSNARQAASLSPPMFLIASSPRRRAAKSAAHRARSNGACRF
jgi:hypothetical protein